MVTFTLTTEQANELAAAIGFLVQNSWIYETDRAKLAALLAELQKQHAGFHPAQTKETPAAASDFAQHWPNLSALGIDQTWHERGMLELLAAEIGRLKHIAELDGWILDGLPSQPADKLFQKLRNWAR